MDPRAGLLDISVLVDIGLLVPIVQRGPRRGDRPPWA
jgi:hypothetical protein